MVQIKECVSRGVENIVEYGEENKRSANTHFPTMF